jgi:small subunit ribosomal protein S18
LTDQEDLERNGQEAQPSGERAQQEEQRRPRRGGRRYGRRPKVCAFCADKSRRIDYKDPEPLRRYLTGQGKIRPRRQTGVCAKHQRRLAREVKRARHLALLPFTAEHIRSS